jgi:hypothetical protein
VTKGLNEFSIIQNPLCGQYLPFIKLSWFIKYSQKNRRTITPSALSVQYSNQVHVFIFAENISEETSRNFQAIKDID